MHTINCGLILEIPKIISKPELYRYHCDMCLVYMSCADQVSCTSRLV